MACLTKINKLLYSKETFLFYLSVYNFQLYTHKVDLESMLSQNFVYRPFFVVLWLIVRILVFVRLIHKNFNRHSWMSTPFVSA